MASYESSVANKYGRETIYINQRESDLVTLDVKSLKKVLESYIPLIVDTHERNKSRIRYLWDYYLGVQDIRNKKRKNILKNLCVSRAHARRPRDTHILCGSRSPFFLSLYLNLNLNLNLKLYLKRI